MKKINSYYFYCAFLIAIFIACKIFYTKTNSGDLLFLLAPTNFIVELATTSNAVFDSEKGFFYQNLNIVINKSCSGFNFLIICFIMLSFSVLRFYKTNRQRITFIFTVLITSYLITIFANTSRILTAIYIMKIFPDSNKKYAWLHQAEGVFIYLSLLIIVSLSFNYFISQKTKYNEKFT
jgi:exosortase K